MYKLKICFLDFSAEVYSFMSLTEVKNNFKKSGFTALYKDNKLMAFRAKLFDEPTRTFNYYDFTLDMLNAENKEYIKSVMNTLPKAKLVSNGAGLLVTKEEMENNVIVQEIKDNTQVDNIVKRIQDIRKYLG